MVHLIWMICGRYYLNKLLCVPCLIIGGVTSGIWNKICFNEFGNVTCGLHKQGSSEHMIVHWFCKIEKKK